VIVPPAGPVVGVGIDLVDVARMRKALERTPTFATRVFTEREWSYCASRPDPAMHAAARFAAKEAVLKSVGMGLFSGPLRDIEVVRGDAGPSIDLRGDHAGLASAVASWRVSLSHTDTTAAAVVVAIGHA
jgi:holo-[acyl-carrier protein] synthase